MQRRGLSLNPITTMYYIAPASLAFLSIPWFFIEAKELMSDPKVTSPAAEPSILGSHSGLDTSSRQFDVPHTRLPPDMHCAAVPVRWSTVDCLRLQ